MTEKEAIAYIKAIKNGLHETGKDFPYRDEIIPVAKDALEMAIKALEQEPCEVSQGLVKDSQEFSQEPCDDAISRQAVLDTIDKWVKSMRVLIALPANEVTPLFESVHELPPVTPQPEMGRWIDIMVGDMPAQACDKCNVFYPLAYTGGGHKFCPNCGCKMQEVEG